jgi:predicted metal-dependent hydrolase
MISAEKFKENVYVLAKQIGVKIKEIHIRKMKRKWASCSSKGRLTFDDSLLKESDSTRLKVTLHELLHLKYPNHGRMFKVLLNAYSKRQI